MTVAEGRVAGIRKRMDGPAANDARHFMPCNRADIQDIRFLLAELDKRDQDIKVLLAELRKREKAEGAPKREAGYYWVQAAGAHIAIAHYSPNVLRDSWNGMRREWSVFLYSDGPAIFIQEHELCWISPEPITEPK